MICLALKFLGVPLVWVFVDGVSSLSLAVWMAAMRSVLIALGATVICLLLALSLFNPNGEMLATLGIAISPMVLGTGLFLITRSFINPFDVGLIVTIGVNALTSLTFVVRIPYPEMMQIEANFNNLSISLGISRVYWIRWMVWPRLCRPIGFNAGFMAALSLGDLGVIEHFGDAQSANVLLKLYQLMGSYRM